MLCSLVIHECSVVSVVLWCECSIVSVALWCECSIVMCEMWVLCILVIHECSVVLWCECIALALHSVCVCVRRALKHVHSVGSTGVVWCQRCNNLRHWSSGTHSGASGLGDTQAINLRHASNTLQASNPPHNIIYHDNSYSNSIWSNNIYIRSLFVVACNTLD